MIQKDNSFPTPCPQCFSPKEPQNSIKMTRPERHTSVAWNIGLEKRKHQTVDRRRESSNDPASEKHQSRWSPGSVVANTRRNLHQSMWGIAILDCFIVSSHPTMTSASKITSLRVVLSSRTDLAFRPVLDPTLALVASPGPNALVDPSSPCLHPY